MICSLLNDWLLDIHYAWLASIYFLLLSWLDKIDELLMSYIFSHALLYLDMLLVGVYRLQVLGYLFIFGYGL